MGLGTSYVMEQTIFSVIIGLFLLGALLIFVSSRFIRDKAKTRELWALYLTEFVIVGGILIPAYIGGLTFALAMMLIGLVALWELYGLKGTAFPPIFKWIGIGI